MADLGEVVERHSWKLSMHGKIKPYHRGSAGFKTQALQAKARCEPPAASPHYGWVAMEVGNPRGSAFYLSVRAAVRCGKRARIEPGCLLQAQRAPRPGPVCRW